MRDKITEERTIKLYVENKLNAMTKLNTVVKLHLLVVFMLFISVTAVGIAQKNKKVLKVERPTSVEQNSVALSRDSSPVIELNGEKQFIEKFSLLDDVNSKVFLAGEYHGYDENYKIRLNLIKYFHKKHNIKKYLAELGYASSYFINKYLITGNIRYLNIVNYSIEGSYDFTRADYKFWQKLYDYNKTLAAKDKILVYGIDLDMQYWVSILAIDDILKRLDLKKVSAEDIAEFTRAKQVFRKMSEFLVKPGTDGTDIYRNVKKIIRSRKQKQLQSKLINIFKNIRYNLLLNQAKIYKYFSKKDIEDIKFIVYNTLTTLEYVSLKDKKAEHALKAFLREETIFSNFLKVYRRYPSEKFYGQWGKFHTYSNKGDSEIHFVELLQNFSENFRKEITTIEILYNSKKHPEYKKASARKKIKAINKKIKQTTEDKGVRSEQTNGRSDVKYKLIDVDKIKFSSDIIDREQRKYIKYMILVDNPTVSERLKEK